MVTGPSGCQPFGSIPVAYLITAVLLIRHMCKLRGDVLGFGEGAWGTHVAGGFDMGDAGLGGSCDIERSGGQADIDCLVHGDFDRHRLAGGIQHTLPLDSIDGVLSGEAVVPAGDSHPIGQLDAVGEVHMA